MAVRAEKVELPGIGFRHDVVISNGRRISIVEAAMAKHGVAA